MGTLLLHSLDGTHGGLQSARLWWGRIWSYPGSLAGAAGIQPMARGSEQEGGTGQVLAGMRSSLSVQAQESCQVGGDPKPALGTG